MRFGKHEIESTILNIIRHMYACELEINPTKISVATSEKVMTVAHFKKKLKLRVVVNGKFSFIYNI